MAKRVINPNPDSGFTGRGHGLLMPYGQLYLVAVFVAILLLAGSALGMDQRSVEAIREEAAIYLRQGKCAEAEKSMKRALAIHEKALGPDHSEVEVAAKNLARTLRKLRRNSEARVYQEQAARIRAGIERHSTSGGQNAE